MFRKLKNTLGIFSLLLIFTQSVYAEELNDISNNKNYEAIKYLYDNGVISGYPDGTFKPLNTVNRAELLKILVGGKGAQPTLEEGYKNCFPDVKEEWFAPFVCYAKTQGWVGGYPDGTFKPANTVITVEAIKMAVNSQAYALSENISAKLYDDVDNSAWYAPYVKVAKDKGILEPTSGNLAVSADVKRGGISEIIYRSMYIKENNLDRFPAEITSAKNTEYEYDITKLELFGSPENWDSDAAEDGFELGTYFYFLSKANPAEGEQMGPTLNQDWSASVSIYDEINGEKGNLLYQADFTTDQVKYDSLGYPFVQIPLEEIKDAGKTHAWVVASFTSIRGTYSAQDDYMIVRNETDTSLAEENQIKELNIQSISGSSYWKNWDSDAEDDGFELSPYFKDVNEKQVYPNSKDWEVTVKIYNAEMSYSKYNDFDDHKLNLVNTVQFSDDQVKYDTTLGNPFIRVSDEDLDGLNVGNGQFIVEAIFKSNTYGEFELATNAFDKRED